LSNKLQLLLVFGAMSSEYSVSCVSAASVLENLNKEKYDVKVLGITQEGNWFLTDATPEQIRDGSWEKLNNTRAILSPSRDASGLVVLKDFEIFFVKIDVIFPVMHGAFGEDGKIQGLFELSGIPYVGCGVSASAVCMDKAITKTVMNEADIKQARYITFFEKDFNENKESLLQRFENELKYPYFIKPANTGSSIGISKVNNINEAINAIELALNYDYKIIAEENIIGSEIEVAVLGNSNPIASICGEIAPERDFYDFEAKYNDVNSKLYIPARLDEQTSQKVRDTAIKCYTAAGCTGLSRVDFFVNKDSGDIIFNEINSLPGFTSISMYPKLFEASGIPYSKLLDAIIDLALEQ